MKTIFLISLLLSLLLAAKVQGPLLAYTYSIPFMAWGSTAITLNLKGAATASFVTFVANFRPSTSPTSCFGSTNVALSTVQSGELFINTLTSSSKPLDLTASCNMNGTNALLPGMPVMIISAVKVDGANVAMFSPCAATGCVDPGNGFSIEAYYANWAIYDRKYNPDNIPYDKINQVMYAFMDFNPNTGAVRSFDAPADTWGLTSISKALLQYPYLKASLSFGGANAGYAFNTMANNPASVQQFVSSSVTLMRRLGFTGIDIDWEWWLFTGYSAGPAKTSLALLKALRKALNDASITDKKQYKLAYAVSGSKEAINGMQNTQNPNAVADFWQQVGAIVDSLGVMSYDYHGGFNAGAPAYFMANYDFANIGKNNVGAAEGWSIKASTNAYIAAGVKASKLIVGIPLYVRTLGTSTNGNNGGLFQTVSGAGFGDLEAGILDYKCFINPVVDPVKGCVNQAAVTHMKGMSQIYNSQSNTAIFNLYGKDAFQPWAYSPTDKTFATFDDVWSVTQKANLVRSTSMGGVMFWEVDGDMKGNMSLINTAKTVFSR